MNKITHKVRCEQWTSIIKECLASGMPKTTWCREHGISDKSFFYWQRILREEAYLTTLESTLTPAVKRIQLQQLQILLKSKWLIKQVHLPVLLNRMLLSEEALWLHEQMLASRMPLPVSMPERIPWTAAVVLRGYGGFVLPPPFPVTLLF